MLKFAYRCLTPNRCDAVAFALLLLYLTMLLMPLLWQCRVAIERWLPGVNDGRFLFMVPYLATWLAFTAVIGTWSKTTWRRQWKFALVGMFSYIALIGYSVFLGLLDVGIYANGTESSVAEYRLLIRLVSWTGLLAWGVSAGIGLFGRKMEGRIKVKRTRIVIVGAVVLFAISVILRVVQIGDGLFFSSRLSFFSFPSVWMLLPILLASLPVCLIQKIRGVWALSGFVAVFLLAIMLLIISAMGLSTSDDVELAVDSTLIYSFLFLMMALLLRQTQDRAIDPEAEQQSQVVPHQWISVWGIIPSVMLPALLFLTLWLDPVTLIFWNGSERWQVARDIRKLDTIPGTHTRFDTIPGWLSSSLGGFMVERVDMEVVFSPDTPANYFDTLPELQNNQLWLTIKNIQPHIDTTRLGRSQKPPRFRVAISGGTITGKQFHDLVQGSDRSWFEKVAVVPGSESPQVTQAGQIRLSDFGPGEVARVIECLSAGSVGQLSISDCKLSQQDCSALFQLGRTTPVDLHISRQSGGDVDHSERFASLGSDIVRIGQQYPDSQVTVTCNSGFFTDQQRWELLLNTEIGIEIDGIAGAGPFSLTRGEHDPVSRQRFWDSIFLVNRLSQVTLRRVRLAIDRSSPTFNFPTDCINHHWAYGSREIKPDKIEALFLPQFEPWQIDQVGKMTSLKNLSLDYTWLPAFSLPTRSKAPTELFPTRVDLGPIQRLVNLERLVLPVNLKVEDFSFLQRLKKLQHLQFDCGVQDKVPLTAKQCPRLESVRLFGSPSPGLLQELAKIKTLDKVTMVQWPWYNFIAQGDRQKARRLLPPRVELKFLPWENAGDVPQAFNDHCRQVRRDLRQKYLDD